MRVINKVTKSLYKYQFNSNIHFLISTKTPNYYQVLNLSKSATPSQIKKSYYKLAQQYHPDKNPDAVDKFKLISLAYTTLKDPQKKRQYDLNNQNFDYNNRASNQSSYTYQDYSYGYKRYRPEDQKQYRTWKSNSTYQYYNPYSKSSHYGGPFEGAYNNFKDHQKSRQYYDQKKKQNIEKEFQQEQYMNKPQRGYMDNPSDYAESVRKGIILLVSLVSLFTLAEILIRIYQFNSLYRKRSYYQRLDPRGCIPEDQY